jgi:hypothetical protein
MNLSRTIRILIWINAIVQIVVPCQAQDINQIINSFHKHDSGIQFLNQEEFEESRILLFKEFTNDYFLNSDTIILIETFNDANGNYNGSVYSSYDFSLKCFYINNSFTKSSIIKNIVESNHCDFFRFVLKMVQENRIEEILKLGKEQNLTPISVLFITIAIIENENIILKSYITNKFIPNSLLTPNLPCH